MRRKKAPRAAEVNSEKTMESQMPSKPQKMGKIKTNMTWKMRVLQVEMMALTTPLFRAVKNDEQ